MGIVVRHQKYGWSEQRAFDEAWRVIVESNPLPATLGRICPHPCERQCNRNEKDEPVAIAAFERFVGDWAIARNLELTRLAGRQPTGKRVAVVGAGPGGISCAYQLARRGHQVTVFDAYPHAGGMLRYGVPSYRLSKPVLDAEIDRLKRLDVVIQQDVQVGVDLVAEELRRTFDAVFIAIGAHRGRSLDIEGADGTDIYSGIDFLRHANSSARPACGPKVLVVGDGPTAVDVARVANRLGKTTAELKAGVVLLRAHRRDEQELGELESEGIRVVYEATPVAIERHEGGKIDGIVAQPARLGEPDSMGVRLPVPMPGDRFRVPADTVIAAVSQTPDWDGLGSFAGTAQLEVDEWGRTQIEGVWSGGDNIMLGTAAESLAQGLRSALSIDARLCGTEPPQTAPRRPVSTGRVKLDAYESKIRSSCHRLTLHESLDNLAAEIEQGITQQQAVYEAGRCLSCGVCFGCERCWMFCTPGCFHRDSKPAPGEPFFSIELAKCDGCRKCADACPSGFIEMA